MRAKDAIDKVAVLKFLVTLPRESRLPFVEMAYMREPTMWETLLAVLRGERTTWTDELQARVQAWETGADKLYQESCLAEQAILQRNGLDESAPLLDITVYGRRYVVPGYWSQILVFAALALGLLTWLIVTTHP